MLQKLEFLFPCHSPSTDGRVCQGFQWIYLLRRVTQGSPAVTSGNTNYFNSSIITSTHIHPVALTSSGFRLPSAAGIQNGHTPCHWLVDPNLLTMVMMLRLIMWVLARRDRPGKDISLCLTLREQHHCIPNVFTEWTRGYLFKRHVCMLLLH